MLVRSYEVRVTKEVCPAQIIGAYIKRRIYIVIGTNPRRPRRGGGDDRVALKESAHLR